ncbi:MAG: Zn-dependent hydrolase [Actinomycetota bacterium]|nr:Zn-dependent hydrolase [Actinomycetota bacterium]
MAWSEAWAEERLRLRARAAEILPAARIEQDEAANIWIVLPGGRDGSVIAGSHLDCVPHGGWLDGCLGVMAAIEAARSIAEQPEALRRTLAVVDWADEEGAVSGRSLLGSSAAAGLLDPSEVRSLETTDGKSFAELLHRHGVVVEQMPASRSRLSAARCYLELHIEQGPVLEAADRACAAVTGCLGVRRSRVRFAGVEAHAGATPIELRHDPAIAAAHLTLAARETAIMGSGLATIGRLQLHPGTLTAVAGEAELVIDVRHADREALERMHAELEREALHAARRTGCEAEHQLILSVDPTRFDPGLVERAAELTGGPAIVSGALHDATAVARAGVPTAMVFVRTKGGISHSREEDADEEDLATGIEAFCAMVQEVALA